MAEIRFDGRVCIVTGAGNGIGRAHALLFGARGANVVVNDMNADAANKVVFEISKAGGTAVADTHSVVEGAKVVQTAIDMWGRIDIVVNNAGILRDVSFTKMTNAQWDLVYEVHCKGTKEMCKAAWPYMREQKYGRIVNTTRSTASVDRRVKPTIRLQRLASSALHTPWHRKAQGATFMCTFDIIYIWHIYYILLYMYMYACIDMQ